jgi:hypothetical protein
MPGSSLLHQSDQGIQDARAATRRWMAVGRSGDPDGRRAGSAAAGQALLHGDAVLLIVFAAPSYDLSELLRGINERSGGVPLIGCTTAGEIATSGPEDGSVVVTALGGEGFSVATGRALGASGRLRASGQDVAACLAEVEDRAHRVLLLLTDGLAGDQQEIVRGAFGVLGAGVPLVGGCAGDNLEMTRTHQFYNHEVLSDAVVGVAIGSDAPIGIGVRHGWRTVGDPMLVTRSANNRVYTVDDQPALDVYLDRLAIPEPARSNPAAFTRFASTHPLGLSRRTGEPHVRFIGGADFEERSLICIAEVPEGGLAWLMEGDEDSVLEATDAACQEALGSLGGQPPLGVIVFDCIARRGVLGEDGIRREVRRIATHAPGAPVAGFYTYGEIARTSGVSGFHNQTLVVLAVS